MAISLEEAKATLKSMFQEFDDEVLESVLRSQRGHMENTIDLLLQMVADAEGLSSVPSQTQQTSLPSDFLTIPSTQPTNAPQNIPYAPNAHPHTLQQQQQQQQQPDLSFWAARPDEEQQVISDERYARMLQDELFMHELRANQQLAHAFGVADDFPSPYSSRPRTVSEFRNRAEAADPERKGMFQSFIDKFFPTSKSRRGYETVQAEDVDEPDTEEGDFANASTRDTMHRRQGHAQDDDSDFERSLGDMKLSVLPKRSEDESKKDE